MGAAVFKTNPFTAIGLPILITGVILGIYFMVGDMPPWILLLLIVPIVFAVTGQKNKVIITDRHLRYEKLFGSDEVPLDRVAQIVIREVETIVDNQSNSNNRSLTSNQRGQHQPINQQRKVERLYYVLDDSGRTFLSFPTRLIGGQQRQRFEDAILAVNPNIELF